jgi:hypothetical protein
MHFFDGNALSKEFPGFSWQVVVGFERLESHRHSSCFFHGFHLSFQCTAHVERGRSILSLRQSAEKKRMRTNSNTYRKSDCKLRVNDANLFSYDKFLCFTLADLKHTRAFTRRHLCSCLPWVKSPVR